MAWEAIVTLVAAVITLGAAAVTVRAWVGQRQASEVLRQVTVDLQDLAIASRASRARRIFDAVSEIHTALSQAQEAGAELTHARVYRLRDNLVEVLGAGGKLELPRCWWLTFELRSLVYPYEESHGEALVAPDVLAANAPRILRVAGEAEEEVRYARLQPDDGRGR